MRTGKLSKNDWKRISKKLRKDKFQSKVNEYGYLEAIFHVLVDLYNQHDVIEDLENCRINPNFHPKSFLRNDLEYYIPQLW